MTKTDRLIKWLDERAAMSDYLSKKENWSPMLKVVARDFLVVGCILGGLFGCYVAWLLSR